MGLWEKTRNCESC